jgi:hypothetical protein
MRAQSAKTSRRSKQQHEGRSKRKRDSARKTARPLTQDEADILYGDKDKSENGIPWNQVKSMLDAMHR